MANFKLSFINYQLSIVLTCLLLVGCKAKQTIVAPAPQLIAHSSQLTTYNSPFQVTDSMQAVITAVMDSAMRAGAIPGGVVCLASDTGVVFLQAYGNRQLLPDTLPMTPQTVFDLASLTKCVATTMAFMTLVHDYNIDINTPVEHFIPQFATDSPQPTAHSPQLTAHSPQLTAHSPQPTAHSPQPITLTHLLSHTSGLPSYLNARRLANRFGEGNREALIDTIATCPRKFEPGAKVLYSCLNFITLQNVIEVVSGERFDHYCQKHVFQPLGMFHTQFFPLYQYAEESAHSELIAHSSQLITPPVAPTEIIQTPEGDSVKLHKAVHDPLARLMNAGISGNAGAFSNAEDLARLAQFLLNNQNDSLVQLFTHAPDSLEFSHRALGWALPNPTITYLGTDPEEGTFGHTGYTGTSMVVSPKQNLAVIILTNRVHPYDNGGVAALRRRITNCLLGSQVNVEESQSR